MLQYVTVPFRLEWLKRCHLIIFDLSFYLALKEHQKDNKGYKRIKIKDIKAAKVKSRNIKFQALVLGAMT